MYCKSNALIETKVSFYNRNKKMLLYLSLVCVFLFYISMDGNVFDIHFWIMTDFNALLDYDRF